MISTKSAYPFTVILFTIELADVLRTDARPFWRVISLYGRRDNGHAVGVPAEVFFGVIRNKEWNIDEKAVFSSTVYKEKTMADYFTY